MHWRPLIIAALACAAATPASARLTHLNIARTEIIDLPAFGATGAYEKIVGTFDGEIDPANPRNAVIVDLDLAPTVNGKVRYSATFTLPFVQHTRSAPYEHSGVRRDVSSGGLGDARVTFGAWMTASSSTAMSLASQKARYSARGSPGCFSTSVFFTPTACMIGKRLAR